MHRLVILLLLLGGTASAGWTGVTEETAGTLYADADSIVRHGNLASMSTLFDFKSFQRMVEVGYFSRKTRIEYDCGERRFRNVGLALLAEPMGQGKEIYADDSTQPWEPVAAGSLSERLLAIACR